MKYSEGQFMEGTDLATQTISTETKRDMTQFLKDYASVGVVGTALRKNGLSNSIHKYWLERYPQYKEMFEEVKQHFVDNLETMAISRAMDKSDSLMAMMLKAHMPEKYGDKTSAMAGALNNVQIILPDSMLTDEEKELLKVRNNVYTEEGAKWQE